MTYYKFLNRLEDGTIKSHYGDRTWTVGETYTVEGKVKACSNGFHASKTIGRALSFVKGNVLAIVEPSGETVPSEDKIAAQSMKIIKLYKWTVETSVAFAITAAESVLHIYEEEYPNDNRPRRALEAASAAASAAAFYDADDAAAAAASAAYAAADDADDAAAASAAASAAAATTATAASAAYAAAYASFTAAYASYAAAYAAHAGSSYAAAYATDDDADDADDAAWEVEFINTLEEV